MTLGCDYILPLFLETHRAEQGVDGLLSKKRQKDSRTPRRWRAVVHANQIQRFSLGVPSHSPLARSIRNNCGPSQRALRQALANSLQSYFQSPAIRANSEQ